MGEGWEGGKAQRGEADENKERQRRLHTQGLLGHWALSLSDMMNRWSFWTEWS